MLQGLLAQESKSERDEATAHHPLQPQRLRRLKMNLCYKVLCVDLHKKKKKSWDQQLAAVSPACGRGVWMDQGEDT
jgi:hypothetical protein